jgi:crotonobetainyl-CoA:carnitine CoA-transferase CaiB-like acyl-CoA transferase
MLLESPQVGGGINTNAEPVVEWAANGVLLNRVGNRSWVVAPQGIFQVIDTEREEPAIPTDDWVAISVETDEQWRALCKVIGDDTIDQDPGLATVSGRQTQHDRIDATLRTWCRPRAGADVVAELAAVGIPAARVVRPDLTPNLEPVLSRNLFERVVHPVAGEMRVVGFPTRFSAGPERWHRSPAPCLGQHNREILEGLLGLTSDEVNSLEAAEVIGNKTLLNLGW